MNFYSAQSPSSFLDRAVASTASPRPTKRRWYGRWLGVLLVIGAVMVVGAWQWKSDTSPIVDTPAILGQSSAAATPRPTPARTFGDLLRQRVSYAGWLAGVDKGSIVLVQPQNGSINRLIEATNVWYGPISAMVWSPDHSQLAYLTLPMEDAAALTKDAAGYAAAHQLTGVPVPSSFPYGRLTILTVATKQAIQTDVEVRNTPKPLVWLDASSIAVIGQTVLKYSVSDGSSTTLVGGGNTSAADQLQTPLTWDGAKQILYFTKVKQAEDGQTVRLVVGLHIQNNQLDELQPLKTGTFDQVTTSQGIDLALSADGLNLAELGGQGLAYVSLVDNGVHALPYSDTWLWLQQSTLSNVQWLAKDKIGFVSMGETGSKVWGVWNTSTNTVVSFGRGSLAGSWDVASGRLALIEASGAAVDIVTPNWNDPTASPLQSWPLHWSDISW